MDLFRRYRPKFYLTGVYDQERLDKVIEKLGLCECDIIGNHVNEELDLSDYNETVSEILSANRIIIFESTCEFQIGAILASVVNIENRYIVDADDQELASLFTELEWDDTLDKIKKIGVNWWFDLNDPEWD